MWFAQVVNFLIPKITNISMFAMILFLELDKSAKSGKFAVGQGKTEEAGYCSSINVFISEKSNRMSVSTQL